jgi:uncharacterized protein YwgA
MVQQQYQAWDRLAVLNLFDSVNKISTVSGNLLAQKLVFLWELESQHMGIRGGHMKFFRYTMGPYSAQLAELVKSLEGGGFLTKGRQLTSRGQYVVEYAADGLKGVAKQAINIANRISTIHGRKSGLALRDYVYTLKVPVHDYGGKKVRVADISPFVDIIVPLAESELREPTDVVTDLMEDLAAEFNLTEAGLDPANPNVRRHARTVLQRAIG